MDTVKATKLRLRMQDMEDTLFGSTKTRKTGASVFVYRRYSEGRGLRYAVSVDRETKEYGDFDSMIEAVKEEMNHEELIRILGY